jgi:flagellar M-ring protein FliF
MASATRLLSNLTPKGRIVLGVSALLAILVPFFLLKMATAPSMTTLLAGVDPAQTGKITAALDKQGISYQLQSNGTAVSVQEGQLAQARIALAEQGLPGDGQPGFELFDKQKLGTSDFQQKVNYQRAMEGEIARTIGQISGVGGAQVKLVLPDHQLFADQAAPATAAVLLAGDAGALDGASVRGMARLVSSSVEGLKPGDVTITDGSGRLLWPAAGGDDGGIGVGGKLASQRRFEQQLDSQLNALLTQTLGAGKASVQTRVDLNVDQATQDRLQYDRKGVPLRTVKDSEQLRGGGSAPAAAGVAGNVPSYAAGAGGGASSNYKNTKAETDWALNKTVTRTKIAPGAVNKLDVAVLVDKSVPAAQVAALKTAVGSAAGINIKRGDSLAVSSVTFAKPPAAAPATGIVPPGIMGMAKYALLGIGTLLFGFFVLRHLRRRESEALPEPTWLREISTPVPLAAIEAETSGMPAIRAPDALAEMEDLAAREPDRVAQQVRSWMSND